ncbi:TonB-dependent receptor [Pseudoflavitalea sp. G-6-1-2]|uniref:TonB-dependent receptor n=1 Tax=Pseudoflavitalea sp. G-6-1-2 TaxID=2728841 RepID=UPI00146F0BBA|nr:TonB-dependent receptor [Pseudoflavitalea sp. G-6-1-2]NML22406.1 TonB-dependent receptor [Pseudoflavitalea sp. G-6-1-2]
MEKIVLERNRSGKGSFCVFIVFFTLLCGVLTAQQRLQTPVTITFQQQSLAQALRQLQTATGMAITFTEASVKNYQITAQTFTATPLAGIFQTLLQKTNLHVKESGIYLVIVPVENPAEKPAGTKPGTLRGRIVDFETAQPLAGATVQLEGSDLHTVANEKGYYSFKNILPAKYTLLVSYAGYQRNSFPDVAVEADKTVVFDIKMLAAGSLKEVVVNASAQRIKAVSFSTEKQLIGEIRSANSVVSGISNEQISKTADRSAAEVVKRIAGITVTDDRFIVVRGMNQRYNITYLNNNIAPSTELYSRAFAYDLLPTSIIDRILVYKSPTAELFGDYAGGAVKVFTKNAKPVRHLDLGLQLSYREGTTGKDMVSYKGSKTDWLGFDNGLRKLPAEVGDMRDGSGLINLKPLQEKVKGFNPDFTLYKRKAMPDMQFYLNFFDNWKLGKWRLYNLSSLTYQLDNRNYSIYRQTGYYNSQDYFTYYTEHDRRGYEQQATQIARVNLLENFTLRFNNRHSIVWQNFLLNEGRSQTSSTIKEKNTGRAYIGQRFKTVLNSFQQRTLYTGNLNGSHYLRADSSLSANWNLGYTFYLDNRPDQRRMNYSTMYDGRGTYNAEYMTQDLRWMAAGSNSSGPIDLLNGMMSRFFQQNHQHTYNAAVDFGYVVNRFLEVKAGSYNLFRTRNVARRYFKVNRYGTQGRTLYENDQSEASNARVTNQELIRWKEQDLPYIWNDKYFRNDGSGLEVYDGTTPADAYLGSEQNNSGYVMTDWKFFHQRLTVNAGVRLEYNRQRVSAAISAGGFVLPVSADLKKTSLLPSFNINWTALRQLTIRAGYGRTVNRPDFKELSPFSDIDYVNQEEIAGNPKLLASTIDNYDLRLEWYPSGPAQNELFNLGVFYKHINNPIERFRDEKNAYDLSGYTGITYKNPQKAVVYGIEAEIRKSLSFIPGNIFRRLSVNLNGTLIKSEVSNKEPKPTSTLVMGSFSGRPLQGQAPYVINAGLYYENPGTGTRFGLILNESGTNVYAVSLRNLNSIKEEPGLESGILSMRPSILELPRRMLDLSLSQRLYRSLQARFTVQNLLDKPVRLAEDNNDNYKYEYEHLIKNEAGVLRPTGDNIFLQYNTGRFFNLSFTYAF